MTDKGLALLTDHCLTDHCLELLPIRVLSPAKGNWYCTAIANKHLNPTEIDLPDCKDVTDKGLALLVRGCHGLLAGKIVSSAKGDRFCAAVAEVESNLIDIDLRDCEAVKDHGLALLVKGCPQLLPNRLLSLAKGDLLCCAVAKAHPKLDTIDLLK